MTGSAASSVINSTVDLQRVGKIAGPGVFVVTAGIALLFCLGTVSAQTLKTIRGNLVRQLRSE